MVLTSKDTTSKKRVAFSVGVIEKPSPGNTLKTDDKKVTIVQKNNKNKLNYHLNKASVTKSLVRHAELPIPSTSASLTKHHERPPTRRSEVTKAQPDIAQDLTLKKPTSHEDFIAKFAAPQLYSSLMLAKKIERVSEELKKPPVSFISKHAEVKRETDGKVLKRLNYQFDEQMYRDLIALDICDDDLLGRDTDKCEIKEFSRTKDKEPNLSDYYEHSKGQEYGIVVKPKPSKIEKVRRYNALSVYHKTQQWQNLN